MSIEIFSISGSPFPWPVFLAHEAKKIPYQTKFLERSKGENRSPEYLTLNPRGRVPTLRDGQTIIRESVAMFAYLEKKQPEHPILGRTPEETAAIWQFISECNAYLDAELDNLILPIYFGVAREKVDQIQRAIAILDPELRQIDSCLRSAFLVGDSPTAADFVLLPAIKSIERAATRPIAASLDLGFMPIAARYPNIATWVERMQAQPGYARTVPPHWVEIP